MLRDANVAFFKGRGRDEGENIMLIWRTFYNKSIDIQLFFFLILERKLLVLLAISCVHKYIDEASISKAMYVVVIKHF